MSIQSEITSLVSIVIPGYRGERFVGQAIESSLNQTHKHLEIIIVNDASPDACAEIAEVYAKTDSRIKIIRRPERGGRGMRF